MLADGDPFLDYIWCFEEEEAATWGNNGEMERTDCARARCSKGQARYFLCLVLEAVMKIPQMRLLDVIGEEVVGETDLLYAS